MMKIIPIGSSPGDGVRWRAEPGAGEEILPAEIRKIFVRLCPGRSIEIQDLLNGSFVFAFPDGIDPASRAGLYTSILSSGHVVV
jgi:hypothetical protein